MLGGRIGFIARKAASLLPVLLFSAACGPGAAERRQADPRPDVVLVSMDTTRADHLSVYGYERETSPVLRALAAEGARFEIAYAPSATTGPSHASLFTSLYPMTHRVIKNGQPLRDDYETLAEILTAAGYQSAAVVSSFVLSAGFGYGQGFDSFDEDFSEATVPSGTTFWEGQAIEGKFYGSGDDTTRRALRWLDGRRARQRPFFLFVHYFDPHDPYLPPPDYRPAFAPGRKESLKLNRSIYLYDLLLSFTDHQIGRLLEGLRERGLAQNTLVVVTGDHGEGLMQHGHMLHGAQIYEESVRVPLIVRWPGRVPAGLVLTDPAAVIDLAPTILELIGLPGRQGFRGTSLAGLLRGEASPDPEREIYLYRRHYEGGELIDGIHAKGEKFAVRSGRWKLIDGPEEETLELYDLHADPDERTNLAGRESEQVHRLLDLLREWRRRNTQGELPTAKLSEHDRARLEALGYAQ